MFDPKQQTVMVGGIAGLDLPVSAVVLVGDLIFVPGQVAYGADLRDLQIEMDISAPRSRTDVESIAEKEVG